MMFSQLTNEERGHLQRLNQNKAALEALKKLFLNVMMELPLSTDVNTLASERIALEKIRRAFSDLSLIRPEVEPGNNAGNIV